MYLRLGWLLLTFVVLLFQLPIATPSRILLMPFPYKSHIMRITTIGKELLVNGHEVHILLPASSPDLGHVKDESGFTVVEYVVKEPDFFSMPQSESDDDWIDVVLKLDPIDEFRSGDVNGFIQLCTNPLEDHTMLERLRRSMFDLALVDSFVGSRCYWIIAQWAGIPYASLTMQFEPWLLRVPALSSFVPFPMAIGSGGGAYTEQMTFSERLWNAWTLLD